MNPCPRGVPAACERMGIGAGGASVGVEANARDAGCSESASVRIKSLSKGLKHTCSSDRLIYT